MNKRNQYAIQCDRLQMKVEHGREIWNSLIASATRIQPAEFVAACDLDGLLDEEETLEDYVASDPDWACYRCDTAQGQVYMLQTAGFEFFFTPDGLVPAYDPHAIMESHDEYGHSALARLLFHSNHPLLQNAYGFECDAVEIEEDFTVIRGTGIRFQILEDGHPVAGMHVLGNQIQDIYVSRARRREGLATEIVARAEAFMGRLEHSSSLTVDGKAFVESQRRTEDDDSLDL
ncbi:hypothetical protein [Pseudomonas sp. S1(2024)]|uniref:hypothetical protein n=1 Tax=Pseudomonas sp. S1(2024) TaxID=3390191 RepID=UPI00397D8D85